MTTKEPNPIDITIGANIRKLRSSRGRSQEWLGKQLGMTFQQIQKYEKGTNRTSASKITMICNSLKVSLADIFTGTDIEGATEEPLMDPKAVKLALSIQSIADPLRDFR